MKLFQEHSVGAEIFGFGCETRVLFAKPNQKYAHLEAAVHSGYFDNSTELEPQHSQREISVPTVDIFVFLWKILNRRAPCQ
jgi:hypothetical protein